MHSGEGVLKTLGTATEEVCKGVLLNLLFFMRITMTYFNNASAYLGNTGPLV